MNNELRPVIFVKGKKSEHYTPAYLQQNLLLKALQVTANPEKLKEAAGVKTMVELHRILDKLSIRKEYHRALMRHGIDLNTIVGGIKEICDDPFTKPETKLKAYQILLKSLGLEDYRESVASSRSWEDTLLEKIESKEVVVEVEDYEVKIPKIPSSVKKVKKEEQELGDSIYG